LDEVKDVVFGYYTFWLSLYAHDDVGVGPGDSQLLFLSILVGIAYVHTVSGGP
jgi:hypothetical protein